MTDDRFAADSHDMIQVRGARENNLADISLDIPKRRLTVFTGVSGSGKSSLVFGTIAAESQRLINETYTAFLQSFMGSPSRPDVDALHNLSAAIVVDQERMGAIARSTRRLDHRSRPGRRPGRRPGGVHRHPGRPGGRGGHADRPAPARLRRRVMRTGLACHRFIG